MFEKYIFSLKVIHKGTHQGLKARKSKDIYDQP